MSKYLQNAALLVSVEAKLTDEQKKAIVALEKEISTAKAKMEMAFKMIEEDLAKKAIEDGDARIARVEVEVETEKQIKIIHEKIKQINPAFTANAKEVVAVKAQELAVNAVEFSGKAAGGLGQFLRPFVQIAKASYAEGKAAALKGYEAPKVDKTTYLDHLKEQAGVQ